MMGDNAAGLYAARVDAVLAQRTRFRGPQPPGDLFAGLPGDHPLVKADPRRPLDPNLEIIASYIQPDDVITDVGGGAGRVSLPLDLRGRWQGARDLRLEVVDPAGRGLAHRRPRRPRQRPQRAGRLRSIAAQES